MLLFDDSLTGRTIGVKPEHMKLQVDNMLTIPYGSGRQD